MAEANEDQHDQEEISPDIVPSDSPKTQPPCNLIEKVLILFNKLKQINELDIEATDLKINYKSEILDLCGVSIPSAEVLDYVLRKHISPGKVQKLVVKRKYFIHKLPVSVGYYSNLSTLDLQQNGIKELPWSVIFLKNLKFLNLAQNLMEDLPRNISHLDQLEMLDVSHNYLTGLPIWLLSFPNLTQLYLRGNPLPKHFQTDDFDTICKELNKRLNRSNEWYNFSPSLEFSNTSTVKTLWELCIDNILRFKIDFISLTCVPSVVKRNLALEKDNKSFQLAKCSRCHGYFTTTDNYDSHACSV